MSCFLKRSTDGITAIRTATAISDHKKVAALLVAGANPTDESETSLSALHDAVYGKMAYVGKNPVYKLHPPRGGCIFEGGVYVIESLRYVRSYRKCWLMSTPSS